MHFVSKLSGGFSLVNVIAGIAIMGIFGVGITRLMSSQVETVSNLETLNELGAIKRKIALKLNCGKTLDYKMSDGTLSCSAVSNKFPKTKEGKTMAFGGVGGAKWDIRGKCIDDELIMQVISGPKRRKSKQDWSKTKYGKDLFLGTSEFCKEFFDPKTPINWEIGGYYVSYFKGGCRHPNVTTGGCTCPKDYSEYKSLDFHDVDCATDFFDEGLTKPCGATQFVCMKVN